MLFEQIQANKRKTVIVMSLFFILLVAVGYAVGVLIDDPFLGIAAATGIAAFYMIITIAGSKSMVLKMNHAKEHAVPRDLQNIVENLALAANIPMPAVYVINDQAPNAFATGYSPTNAAVAVTSGLMERLNYEELEGVIAHEISHIRNYDIRLATIAIALASVFSILSDLGLRMVFAKGGGNRNSKTPPQLYLIALAMLIFAPIAATMIHLALSRNREYLADASAVDLTRNPNGLIGALAKISSAPVQMREVSASSASLYIVNPLKKGFASLFSTHPPIDKRIERLAMM